MQSEEHPKINKGEGPHGSPPPCRTLPANCYKNSNWSISTNLKLSEKYLGTDVGTRLKLLGHVLTNNLLAYRMAIGEILAVQTATVNGFWSRSGKLATLLSTGKFGIVIIHFSVHCLV